jgi:hypothetical protein
MSRRRGIIRDEDDETPAQTSRSHRSSTVISRGSTTRPAQSTVKDQELPYESHPCVAKLGPEELQRIQLLDSEKNYWKTQLSKSIGVFGDTAVALEEIEAEKPSEANKQVIAYVFQLTRLLMS